MKIQNRQNYWITALQLKAKKMTIEKLTKEKQIISGNLFQIKSQYKTNFNYLEATNMALKDLKDENESLKAKLVQDQKVAKFIIDQYEQQKKDLEESCIELK